MNFVLMLVLQFCMVTPQEIQPVKIEKAQVNNKRDEYRVGPGDSLEIKVFGTSKFDQITNISNSGKIHIPYLGIMKVIGMSLSEIQSEISQRLMERKLIKSPLVQISIAQYRAHPAYILGAVIFPGQFLIKDEMNIMDLVSRAGGFSEKASLIGYLYRRNIENIKIKNESNELNSVDEKAIEIDFQKLYDGTKPELNMKLQGGDVLYVPERLADYFFVVGDVMRPSAYEIPFGQKMIVSQAIANAGGPTRTAKMSKGILMRYNKDGERQELAIDFKAIIKGEKPDFFISANDIIFIPGSPTKTLGYGLLDLIPRTILSPIP